MLKGRLGLETARVPHADRYGLLWLTRGNLTVDSGTLRFTAAGSEALGPGEYDIPYQTVSLILLGPGTTISHDAIRLMARHGTGFMAVGEDGIRRYSSPPFGPDHSRLARRQAAIWADSTARLDMARRMYSHRLGEEVNPDWSLDKIRGIEGARVREMYKLLAHQFGLTWHGRRYDRAAPAEADQANQAINHASSAVGAASEIAVAATATIPQLGFIHEDSSRAFALDIADMFREEFVLMTAFQAVRDFQRDSTITIERQVRRLAGHRFRRKKLIPQMIDRIKELLDADDGGGDPERA